MLNVHVRFVYFLVWHGVMFIRQGLYQGGVYRFQLFIPDTYPDADCPVGLYLMVRITLHLNHCFSCYKMY